VSNHSALATGHNPDAPTSLWNHNHNFDDNLRCRCGKTWTQQVAHPTLCSKNARGANKAEAAYRLKGRSWGGNG
jgi:hypothetical protein